MHTQSLQNFPTDCLFHYITQNTLLLGDKESLECIYNSCGQGDNFLWIKKLNYLILLI